MVKTKGNCDVVNITEQVSKKCKVPKVTALLSF
jgi:hypothetical protein